MARKKPLFQGDSEIDQLFRIFRFVKVHNHNIPKLYFKKLSILTTPNETTWEGVSQLPDYKPTFPNWHDNHLEAKMGISLNNLGMDLLSVSLHSLLFAIFTCF
jgi:hypothetical protein